MGQHPVTQRARAPSIDLLSQRIRHHDRHANEPDEPVSQRIVNQLPASTASYPYLEIAHPIATAERIVTRRQCATHAPADRSCECCGGVSLISKHKLLRRTDLAEVLDRIDAHERPGRAILFTRIFLSSHARWIERVSSQRLHLIATGSSEVSGATGGSILKLSAFFSVDAKPEFGGGAARHHRDRVVRTLRRAIKTADARRLIDIDVSEWIAKDRACRTASHTFRITQCMQT